MTEMVAIGDPEGLAGATAVRPLALEDLSAVRYVHASAVRLMAGSTTTEDEVFAYVALIESVAYTDHLIDAIQRGQLYGAWIDRELVATAGWTHGDDQGLTARLIVVYVRPMFSDAGIGRHIVSHVELVVARAGFHEISVRSTANAALFFDRLGYRTTSHGVRNLSATVAMPVVFMRKRLIHPPLSQSTRH